MKATELRIGNYVYLEATRENEIVKAIDYTVDERCVIKTKGGDSEYLTGVEPIPLTEEWLINLGFVKDKLEVGLYHYSDFEIMLTTYLKYKDCVLNHTKYVHQLQNLYFALTGKELNKL